MKLAAPETLRAGTVAGLNADAALLKVLGHERSSEPLVLQLPHRPHVVELLTAGLDGELASLILLDAPAFGNDGAKAFHRGSVHGEAGTSGFPESGSFERKALAGLELHLHFLLSCRLINITSAPTYFINQLRYIGNPLPIFQASCLYFKAFTIMKEEIVQALRNSLVGDNTKLQQTSNKLSEFSKVEGYCMCLMEIVDEPSFDLPLKQAALIQLKNNIKSKWKPKNQKIELTPNEKHAIRDNLILAVIRCAKNFMLIKLYREVFTTIIGYEFETWLPLHDILKHLATGENLAPVFQCIVAINTNFEFSVIEKQRSMFNDFLKEVLPAVFEAVKKNLQNAELVYLGLKILWKAVHYEIEDQIKVLCNSWMELILLTISAYNEDMQKKLDETQNKNTPEFYYYHSKKWATRILMRFVQRHAKSYQYGKVIEENVAYSKYWYQNYGLKFCETIVRHLDTPVPTTKKIRYLQLKVIQAILADKPSLLYPHSKHFQYDVLIRYMRLTPEDQALARDDVVEYLRNDDEMSTTYSNIKKVATEVWNSFMQFESKHDRDKNVYYPGPLFEENIQFIMSKISSDNLLEKELGMYLLCENRLIVNRVPALKQQMESILDKYVVPELANPALLIRAKANDMFYQYGKDLKSLPIITKTIEGVFRCLTEDANALVRIKAAIALNSLVSQPEAKHLLHPYLKNILEVYLKLIQQYDLEQVVNALEYFISDFAESIGPFSVDLFRYLSNIFVKMFNKDAQMVQNEDYENELELAASGCIKTMTQILESPLEGQVRQKLQPFVLELCGFLFTNESFDYTEDLMHLMRVHVEKIDKITPACWFFYQVIVYFIAGIPQEMWNQIENINIPAGQKQILANIRQGDNIEYLEHVVPVIRNYFGRGFEMILGQKPEFKTNFIHLVFYLVNYVYKESSKKDSELEGEIHLDCCSILLVYLMETFPPDMTKIVIGSVWNICKFNLLKGKSRYLKEITCQLISVMLWKHGPHFLEIIFKQNQLDMLVKQITTVGKGLDEPQSRKRVILGIITYLGLVPQSMDILGPHANKLFRVMVKLVIKNCRSRLIINTTDPNLKKQLIKMEDNDSDEGEQENLDDDDEDMWDEEYDDNHVSVLKRVNELSMFKQAIEGIRAQNQPLYAEMLKQIPPERLSKLDAVLLQAELLPEK